MKQKILIASLIIGFNLSNSFAQTKVVSLFTDHMILQRNSDVKIWGTDISNKTIEITGSWGEQPKVKVDEKGKWKTIRCLDTNK